MTACLRLVLLVILAAFTPSVVLAHAQLLSTEPADSAVLEMAPKTLTLRFNEPVSPLRFTLVGPDGIAVAVEASGGTDIAVQLPPALATGTHLLSWRVVSIDGHPIGGSLMFSIGRATGSAAAESGDPAVAIALWVGKALFFISMFVGVGAAVFASAAPLPNGARRVAIALSATGVIAVVGTLGLQGLDALGLPLSSILDASAWAAGLSTSYGLTAVVAAGAFLVAPVALTMRPRRTAVILGWSAGGMAALSLALSGHASAAAPQWLTRPAVFLHLAGILFWVGALLPLGQLLRERSAVADHALAAFSRWIPFAIVPLVLSGAVLAVVQLGWPGPHWVSPYGFILAAKLGLLVALFALALANRRWLTAPALAGNTAGRARLRRSIGAEMVLVLLVLGLVAGWRFTPPPRALAAAAAAAAEPRSVHLMDAEIMATVTVTPGRAGPVTAGIEITDSDGVPRDAQSVTLILAAPDLGIEPLRREAMARNGEFHVEGLTIPIPGRWQIEVDVRLSRFELHRLASEIAIRQ